MNYWNKNIQSWTDETPPQNPHVYYVGRFNHREWKKITIGNNEYYGKSIGFGGKLHRIVFKITPIFIASVALAPISVPLFLANGTYRKLGRLILEVHYSSSIKYIVKVAEKNLSKSVSLSVDDPEPLESDLNHDVMSELLLSAKFSNADEAKRYLETLYCVSKALHPFVDKAALDFVNEGIITIGDLPGIGNEKAKIFDYLESSGDKLKHLDLSLFSLTDEDLQKVVTHCPNIETLLIGKTDLTDAGMDELEKLSKLNHLSVRCAFNFDKLFNLKKLSIKKPQLNLSLDALSNLEELNVNNAYDVPSLDKLVKLKTLNIQSDYYPLLPSLDQLVNLEKLNINCKYLIQLPSLDQLVNLQELSIVGAFQQMPSLDLLVNLKKLDLSFSCFIPFQAFAHLIHLEELNVSNQFQLQQFPGIDHLANLRKLTLNCPYVQVFSLDKLDNLEELHITNNHVKDLSKVNTFVNLEKLSINNCYSLQNLSIDQLVNLKELSLKNTRQVPSLDHLDQLEKLNISTPWQTINCSLDSLIHLRELNLEMIEIPSLDQLHALEKMSLNVTGSELPSFDTLKNMKELSIVAYQVKQLPSLDQMENLEKLSISSRSVPSLEKLNLTELSISNCNSKLPSLNSCTRLKKLIIKHSIIKTLPSLANLINLEEINIDNCGLKEVRFFANNKKLRNIDINQYSSIKKVTGLEHLGNLEHVYID